MASRLVVFLTLGESVENLEASGQWERFRNEYLRRYCEIFEQVYIVSYGQQSQDTLLPNNCCILVNQWNLHRYMYMFAVSLIYQSDLSECQISRTMQATGGVPAVVCKWLWGVRMVVTYGFNYETFAEINSGWLVAKLTKLMVDMVVRTADRVIVTTKELRQSVAELTSDSVLIPNGVNLTVFSAKTDYKLHNPVVLLSVGRLTLQKRFDLAIRAVGRLKHKQRYHLTLIGRGDEKAKLVHLAKAEGVHLSIIDPIPHSQVSALLKEADIYLHTSVTEGHPKALLEAIAVGIPVVVSRSKKVGYDFLPGSLFGLVEASESDVARKIEEISADLQRRQQYGGQLRGIAERQFNLDELLQKEMSLLTSFEKRQRN